MNGNYGDNMNNNFNEDFLNKDPKPSLTFEPEFEEVETLSTTVRGEGGFGSTGK